MTDTERSSWAVGWTIWAAVWMWLLGFFHVLAGFAAVVEDEIFVATPDYVYALDLTTWGWVHLILGIIVLIAGFSLFNGAVWARTVGVILAVISTVANFVWLPYNPIWGLLMITANVFVIWALTVHGRDAAAS